jgi:hypothetical protein
MILGIEMLLLKFILIPRYPDFDESSGIRFQSGKEKILGISEGPERDMKCLHSAY